MNKQFNIPRLDGPSSWLGVVGAGILLLSALFLGAILFVVLLGVVAVLGAVVAGRLWWLRRKLGASAGPSRAEEPGRIIDAEYSVVDDEDP